MANFVSFNDEEASSRNKRRVPDDVKQALAAALALQKAGGDMSQPVYNRNLGIAKMLTGGIGGIMEGITSAREAEAQKKYYSDLANINSPDKLSTFSPPSGGGGGLLSALLGAFKSPGGGSPVTVEGPDGTVSQNIGPLAEALMTPEMPEQPKVAAYAPSMPDVEIVRPDQFNRLDAMADKPSAPRPAQPTAFSDLFAAKEQQYGLPSGYLQRTAQIESAMDPNAQNPRSTAGGLFQFLDKTARQYGLENKFDPNASTDAAARLARDNADVLRRNLGREPSAAELYLAHQQGATGASKILANPNSSVASLVGNDAAALNRGSGLSGQQFADNWIGKFNRQPQQAAAPPQMASAPPDVPMPRPRPDEAPADFNSRFAAINAPMQQGQPPVNFADRFNAINAPMQQPMMAYADNAAVPPDARLAQATMPPQFGTSAGGGLPPQNLTAFNAPPPGAQPPMPPQMAQPPMPQPQMIPPQQMAQQQIVGQSRGGMLPVQPPQAQPSFQDRARSLIAAHGSRMGDKTLDTLLQKTMPDYEFKPRDDGTFVAINKNDKNDVSIIRPGDPQSIIDFNANKSAAEKLAVDTAKDRAEALSSYKSMQSKLPGLGEVVTKLHGLADEGTYTLFGQGVDKLRKETGMDPRRSAVARTEYVSMVDNQILPMLRDTFGAQFTKAEGDWLRATLGNPDTHPTEKKAVLNAFITQKRRDVEATAARYGMQPPDQTGGPAQTGGGPVYWGRGPDGKPRRMQ